MNVVALLIAGLLIGVGVFSLSAAAREGLACLILFGGVAAWAKLSTSGYQAAGTMSFLGLFALSMFVWKPRVFLWPLKEFFLGFFIAKGVKASGVLKQNPLKQPRVIADRPAHNFIYVIKGDHNMVKIGVSTAPDARLATLQTGSAHKLQLMFAAPCGDAYGVERAAHERLKDYSINCEWFDVTPDTAIRAIRDSAEKLGQPLFRV